MSLSMRSWIVLCCVALVKSKNCTLEEFVRGSLFSPHFDTAGMQPSYADQKAVRVNCNVGYSGFFKLTCKDGTWEPKGSGCQPRSCGHPGDTPFADFELMNATDFVFGSKVVYICHKGYHMVSRRNYRNCLTGGWDGFVPVCEAQQCPVIHVQNNVKVIGDLEESAFGNVVLFSCKLNSEVLKGPLEIYCDEHGDWSGIGWTGVPPVCEEIKCTPPVIANGFVLGDAVEYRENELLNYRCEAQFKVASGTSPKCMKVREVAEWSPAPRCDEIKCQLKQPPLQGTTYEPAFNSEFHPGQTLKVTCEDTYWIERTGKSSVEVTCKANGEWSITPVCQEFFCSNQRDEHVSNWGVRYYDQKKIGDRTWYHCRPGYTSTNGATHTTCTRDGWEPKPLCRATFCERLDIENARITYNSQARYSDGEDVSYSCTNNKRFTISCDRGEWTGVKQCSGEASCTKPRLPNGFVAGPYHNTIYYTCDAGYKLPSKAWWGAAQCEGGAWSGLQTCIERTKCGEPPLIPNGQATPSRRPGEEILQITCKQGYFSATEQLTCHNGKWLSSGASLKTLCRPAAPLCSPPPRVDNAVVLEAYQKEFLSDSTVTYVCRENFTMEGENTITCKAGTWEEKNIICIQKPCPSPEDTPHGNYEIIFGKDFVYGTTIKYTCEAGYRLAGRVDTRTCLLDGWTDSVPLCELATCKTGAMHPGLRVTGLPAAGEAMEHGHTLWFECSDEYYLEGSSSTYCLQSGEWNHPIPTCSKPCPITGVPDNVNYRPLGDELLRGRNLTFTCKLRGHFIQGQAAVQCLAEGRWSHEFPTCGAPVSCGNPPPLLDGDTKETLKHRYNHNDRVEFICQEYYTMQGGPHKTCINGEWSGDMTCLKPCTVDSDSLSRHNIRFRYSYQNKLYSAHDDEVEFLCRSGRPVRRDLMRTRCLDGKISLPTCQ